jgi:hypothetical protein
MRSASASTRLWISVAEGQLKPISPRAPFVRLHSLGYPSARGRDPVFDSG